MQKLEEKILQARWKSYKVFRHSGEIRLHTSSSHREFHFSDDRTLSIKECKKGEAEKVVETDQWILDFNNRKHYLKIPQNKMIFEIITVNHTVLVLLDNSSWEKIFLTREECWQDFLQSNSEMAL
jgi:hypothetical protein